MSEATMPDPLTVMLAKMDRMIEVLQEGKAEPSVPFAERLISAETCGQLMECSSRHFKERIASQPTFPRPARLSLCKGGIGHPRWKAREVLRWIDEQRKSA